MRALLVSLLLLATPVHAAEEVVLGLSQDEVAISVDFDGSEILIYGAVKREEPIASDPLHVIVTVAGPDQTLTVRKKDKRFGIWVNTETVEVDAAPSFYAVATSAPWEDVIADVEDLRYQISIPRAIRSVGAEVENTQSFSDAVIRIRKSNDTYQMNEGAVGLHQQTLFDTALTLPANLTEGEYPTRVFLTRNKEVISVYQTVIDVRKVGLERWLYSLSRQQPLIYGLMSLAIAIAAGWGASAMFRIFRPQ
jgi:uncharacterized protein (TIGR02186 family)